MATGTALLHTDSDKIRMRNEIRQQIVTKLLDKEYRDTFVSEQINTGLAFQIRAMREARSWTQSELGNKAKMAQSRISLMEDANYSRFSLNTLKRLASAFDVALIVRFEPFSSSVEYFTRLDSSQLNAVSFDQDVFVEEPSPIIASAGTFNNLLSTCETGYSFSLDDSMARWLTPSQYKIVGVTNEFWTLPMCIPRETGIRPPEIRKVA